MAYQDILQKKNFIGGEWMSSNNKMAVYDKYSQRLIAEIDLADQAQINLAIQKALAVSKVFKKFSMERRIGIIEKLYTQLQAKAEDFAQLIAAEGGKPISYARSEVYRALDNLKTGIREAYLFTGEQIPIDYLNGKNKTAYTIRQPLGIVLGITPFNFPLNLALHKLIPAIAVGAPIVLKPAPQAPLTLLAFAKLIENTDLPKGAISILITDNENAQILVEDDNIKVFSFTGSDKIGWMLKSLANKKKVLLEMGGNAAAIVDDAINLQRAARKLVYGSFLNAGQICISTQRIYVLEHAYEDFLKYFIEETKKIKSGDVRDQDVINSSMISEKDLLRIKSWIDEAVSQGAKVLYGGNFYDKKSNIFEPTILSQTNNQMKVNREEAFAPVVMIEKVRNFAEAIDLINESRYGLQAGVFTNNLEHIQLAQADLDVGSVIVNDVPGFRIDSMPYGGIKDSGIGKEGARYVMHDYTESKLIVIG